MAVLHCRPTLIPLQAGRTVGRGRTNNRRIPLGIKELLLDQPTWFEVGGFRWELGPSRLGLRAVRKDASPLSTMQTLGNMGTSQKFQALENASQSMPNSSPATAHRRGRPAWSCTYGVQIQSASLRILRYWRDSSKQIPTHYARFSSSTRTPLTKASAHKVHTLSTTEG